MSHRMIPSTFVKSVLKNGVGRYVCQLQRLTLKFCKSHAGSRGMRDFVENSLIDFTRSNPGVVVYLQPRRHRTPRLVAEYLNGGTEQLYVNNHTEEEICQWIKHLQSKSGQDVMRIRKYWHTDNPSIQGIWTPITNRDTENNIKQFPDEELSVAATDEISASERLLEIAQQFRQKNITSEQSQDLIGK